MTTSLDIWTQLSHRLNWGALWALVVSLVYVLGIMNALHAVMRVRLSQSAIAWSVFLVTMPWLGIPLYWIFGRRKFEGYTNLMRLVKSRHDHGRQDIAEFLKPYISDLTGPLGTLKDAARELGAFPFTRLNRSVLLKNGEATYGAILEALAGAKSYILFQVYIFEDDATGQRFLDALIAAAKRGVRVHLLYDEIGSGGLGTDFHYKGRQAGLEMTGFRTTKGTGNRFQINFRNHRKVIVVDGHTGFVGGLNIGNEYLGLVPPMAPWRDTHLKLEGPAVKGLQFSFMSDWFWATDRLPEVSWDISRGHPLTPTTQSAERPFPDPCEGCDALILPTGPNDDKETCTLFFGALIDLAQERIWIASPYFVPDEATLTALKIAALRGVDVRILLPRNQDHKIMKWCAWSYYEDLMNHGVQVFEYEQGFMHQKVILIDTLIAGVGTVNLDNRSFKLNFEIMAYVSGAIFVHEVDTMLREDFSHSQQARLDIVASKTLPMRILIKVTRLFSAIL